MAEPNELGLAVARRYARWYIGDASWANSIIYAYLNPEQAQKDLDFEVGAE